MHSLAEEAAKLLTGQPPAANKTPVVILKAVVTTATKIENIFQTNKMGQGIVRRS